MAVINPRFTKPIDAAAHEIYGHEADLVVTLEDHVLMGGYGSAVLELFSEKACDDARRAHWLARSIH